MKPIILAGEIYIRCFVATLVVCDFIRHFVDDNVYNHIKTLKCRMSTCSRKRLIQFDLGIDKSNTVSSECRVGRNRVGLTRFRTQRSRTNLASD
ncbi:hypothetical protein CR513_59304, partial [Mucuna pruriens]